MAIPIGGQGGHVPTSGFVVETMPQRIVFGAGAIATVPDEVSRAELKRVLVIASGSSASIAARISGDLGSVVAGHLDEARQHVPRQLAEAARMEAITTEADGLIAVGGGSSIGLAKAVAVRLGLPIIAVPVTYSGSEVSAVYGITDEHKRTSKDPRALPRVVIYDPELGSALSSRVTAATGFNALAHAVEALYCTRSEPHLVFAGRGGDQAVGECPSRACRSERRHRSAVRSAARGLSGRVGIGNRRHGAAAQARPRVGGHARSDPCRGARRAPPPRHRVQPIRGQGTCWTVRRPPLVLPIRLPVCGVSGARSATRRAWPNWVSTRRCWTRLRSKQ